MDFNVLFANRPIYYTLIDNIGLFESDFDLSKYNSIIFNSSIHSINKSFYSKYDWTSITLVHKKDTILQNELFQNFGFTDITLTNQKLNSESYLHEINLNYPYLLSCRTDIQTLNINLFKGCNPYGIIKLIKTKGKKNKKGSIIEDKPFDELIEHYSTTIEELLEKCVVLNQKIQN